MKTEMYAYLGISDFNCDPSEITKIVGVRPTETYKKGDLIGKTKLRCRQSGWQHKVKADTSLELDALIKKIFKKFRNTQKLKLGISKGKGAIVCVAYVSDRSADLSLSLSTIKKIASLNCEFLIDYYIVPEEA